MAGGLDVNFENDSDNQPKHKPMREVVHRIDLPLKPGASDEDVFDALLATQPDQLIPWETCVLPSLGLYYGWDEGSVFVRAMTQTAEKVLASPRLAQTGQSIDYMLRECCKFPPDFNPADLLVGDQIFLLYYIRGITFGNDYEFMATCTNCSSISTHNYDLNNLAGSIKFADKNLGSEPFKIVLPYCSEVAGREVYVHVRFMRCSDSANAAARRKVLNKYSKAKDKTSLIDETISDSFDQVIVSVMGSQDQFKKKQFIERLHSRDTSAIREWLKDNTPGVDPTITMNCPSCDQEFTIALPITEHFFRPAKQ